MGGDRLKIIEKSGLNVPNPYSIFRISCQCVSPMNIVSYLVISNMMKDLVYIATKQIMIFQVNLNIYIVLQAKTVLMRF
ncbi:hypothetical protein DP113_13790 [Brasilonema octagenarum UFV-E1]|jgi:hypothetical protein|uniref:Uncharacterized protein n=2 Tax=Brasilonema TaxID=383614 RepID=A0A856MEW8_9CYAN|nr:hypothetical protein [Brasilonema octagenarum UFV-OR1]QDL08830.1 hypothetical protein DP114_13850 [Brasilonema sennae CENA114]QDL15187.1 hypothetical protein DP113_13790 [Brasilonema octagenarum UFV-E1]